MEPSWDPRVRIWRYSPYLSLLNNRGFQHQHLQFRYYDCPGQVPYSPLLPRITLTDPLHLSNGMGMTDSNQRQRSRSIGVVETGFNHKYIRRAKTPSPKRSKFLTQSNNSYNNNNNGSGVKTKTPSPRSLSPKYCRRSSNCSVSSSSSESNLVYGGSRKGSCYSNGGKVNVNVAFNSKFNYRTGKEQLRIFLTSLPFCIHRLQAFHFHHSEIST
jgi:hypothetical protein